jgi:hypothetical protein
MGFPSVKAEVRDDNLSLKVRQEKEPENERVEVSELGTVLLGENDGRGQ